MGNNRQAFITATRLRASAAAGLVAIAIGMVGGGSAGAYAQPASEKDKVVKAAHPAKVNVIADSGVAVAGEVLNLGITIDLEPGWHVYWPGINDSGLPPKWTLTLPAGWTELPAVWPFPHRYELPGDIVDHTLEGKVTIRVPVSVGSDAKVGSTETIGVKLDWMVCKEACLLGDGEFKVSVAVAASGTKPPPAGASVNANRDRIASVSAAKALPADGSVTAVVREGKLMITAPGATKIEYMPSMESRKPADMVSGVTASGESLSVAFDADQVPSVPVRGLVAVTAPVVLPSTSGLQPRSETVYYSVDFTAPAVPATEPVSIPSVAPVTK